MNSVLGAAATRVAARRHHSFADAVDAVLEELSLVMPAGTVFLAQPEHGEGPLRVLGARGESLFGLAQGTELQADGENTVPDPAQLERIGMESFVAVPLETSEGHHVGSLCAAGTSPELYHEDHLDVLTVMARLLARESEVVHCRADLQRLNDELRDRQGSHPLTGLADRTHLLGWLRRERALTRRGTHRSCLVTCRLEGLDAIEAQHGRALAELLVKDAAETMRGTLRESDHCAHVDDDMLAAVLVGCETLENAGQAVMRFRVVLGRVAEARPASLRVAFGFCDLGEIDSAEDALATAESDAQAADSESLTSAKVAA